MTEMSEGASRLDEPWSPAKREGEIYAAWESRGYFKPQVRGAKPRGSEATFSICMPPPNVTGSLHIGHALNNTLQDALCRYHRMRGEAVLWQPGMDHAGIATQMVVERKLAAEGRKRSEMSREEFVEEVWNWKEQSGGRILEQLKRLGSSADWSRTKFTLGERPTADNPSGGQMADAVTTAFVRLYEQGLIYRDKRLVNWDPHFQTAISDLEVENVEVDGHFWHFKYLLADGETYTYVERDADGTVTLEEERDYIAIATTRPETMLGDGAVAVHPDDARYAPIVGKMVRLPLADRLIPIITDDYPDPDFGSGAVKITGAHDFNDYEVAKRHDIPMYSLMGTRGEMIQSPIMPEKYVGMDRFEARKAVVEDIDAEGLLIRVEDKMIMQPIGDRSKAVIEPMLTDQWFVDAEALARPAMEAVARRSRPSSFKTAAAQPPQDEGGTTSFIPTNWTKTYDHWMENIQPWCISRQLWWGHRVPAWYGPEGDIVVSEDPASVPSGYTRDPDVLDTWFSSALWPFSTLGWPEQTQELERFYPTSVLITAFDIIFFWVARMMMMGLHFRDTVPFQNVYIHALVLDEDGKKMSKSEGNTLDPLDLIDGIGVEALVEKRTTGLRQPEKASKVAKRTRKRYPNGFEAYGADALRFALAAQAGQGRDIRLSVERIAGYRNFGTKLWNAARFLRLNGCAARAEFDPANVNMPINRWIVGEASKAILSVSENLDRYRFNDAADAIYKFSWGTFCDWYIELSKTVLGGADGTDKLETQATAAWALDTILKLLHPFMPFITEELWHALGERNEWLIVAQWPEPIASQTEDDIDRLIALISELRSVRAEMNVPPSRKAALIVIGKSEAFFEAYAGQLEQMGRVSEVGFAEKISEGLTSLVVDGTTYGVPTGDLVDVDAEHARLSRAIAKLEDEIIRIDRKLENQGFVSKAPTAIVQGERVKRQKYQSEIEALKEAQHRLL